MSLAEKNTKTCLAHHRSKDIINFRAQCGDAHAKWLLATIFDPEICDLSKSERLEYLRQASNYNLPFAMAEYAEHLICSPEVSYKKRIDGWCLLVKACQASIVISDKLINKCASFPFENQKASKALMNLLENMAHFHSGLYALKEFIAVFRRMPSSSGFDENVIKKLIELAKSDQDKYLSLAVAAVAYGVNGHIQMSYIDQLEELVQVCSNPDLKILLFAARIKCNQIARDTLLPISIPLMQFLEIVNNNHPSAGALLLLLKLNGNIPVTQKLGSDDINCIVELITQANQRRLPTWFIIERLYYSIYRMSFYDLERVCLKELENVYDLSKHPILADIIFDLHFFRKMNNPNKKYEEHLETMIKFGKLATFGGIYFPCFRMADMLKDYDIAEAMYWYEVDLRCGTSIGIDDYAALLIERGKRSGDKVRGVEILTRAFENGNIAAGRKLAEYHYRGEFLPKDDIEVIRIMQICTSNKDAESLLKMANYLDEGIGGIRHQGLAGFFKGKAVDAGYDVRSVLPLEYAAPKNISSSKKGDALEPEIESVLSQEEVDMLLNAVISSAEGTTSSCNNDFTEGEQNKENILCQVITFKRKSSVKAK